MRRLYDGSPIQYWWINASLSPTPESLFASPSPFPQYQSAITSNRGGGGTTFYPVIVGVGIAAAVFASFTVFSVAIRSSMHRARLQRQIHAHMYTVDIPSPAAPAPSPPTSPLPPPSTPSTPTTATTTPTTPDTPAFARVPIVVIEPDESVEVAYTITRTPKTDDSKEGEEGPRAGDQESVVMTPFPHERPLLRAPTVTVQRMSSSELFPVSSTSSQPSDPSSQ